MQQFLKRGFTVVELLIVVVIIVILATIATAAYIGVTERGHDAALQSDFDGLSDRIDLKTLDDNVLPPGGATDTGTGTATNFTGITYRVSRDSYDPDVTNLYYCTGNIGGLDVYAIVAKSTSGRQYVYKSNAGTSELSTAGFSEAPNPSGICTEAGFSPPYTYSYGYSPSGGWSTWVTP